MKTITKIWRLIIVGLVVLLLSNCENNENAPKIMGVKVAGYGWAMKQAFHNKGFTIIEEQQDAFVMEGKYDDKLCYICIVTGKRDRVLIANLKIMGFSLEDTFDKLESEYNSYYGTPKEKENTTNQKHRQWNEYIAGNYSTQIVLDANISTIDTGQKSPETYLDNPFGGAPMKFGGNLITINYISEINLSVFNMTSIGKYKK